MKDRELGGLIAWLIRRRRVLIAALAAGFAAALFRVLLTLKRSWCVRIRRHRYDAHVRDSLGVLSRAREATIGGS